MLDPTERAAAAVRSDPIKAFSNRARVLIRMSLNGGGWAKARKTTALLGCSVAEFRAQIERQFVPGMGWHNMHLWHLDHIVPSSAAKTQQEAEALCRAGNFRPLWSGLNLSKGAKATHLL